MSGVAAFDSHGRAPCLLDRALLRAARLLFSFTRTSRTVVANDGELLRMLKPVDPALSVSGSSSAPRESSKGNLKRSISSRHAPRAHPKKLSCRIASPRVQRPCVQRPNATPLEPVSAHLRPSLSGSLVWTGSGPFLVAQNPGFRGRQKLCPRAVTGRRSGWFRSPFGSDRRDPNTLAPNRLEARTTPLRPSRISARF